MNNDSSKQITMTKIPALATMTVEDLKAALRASRLINMASLAAPVLAARRGTSITIKSVL
jgi:hypothetical protein